MRLIKYCALGNDYWICNPEKCTKNFLESIKLFCNRHWGLGSDGILYGPKERRRNLEFFVDIYNADGSLAEISGNGLTIFSRYLLDYQYVKLNESFYLISSKYCKICATCLKENGNFISKIILGKGNVEEVLDYVVPEALQRDFDLPSIVKLYKVNMGNPHCVVPVRNVSRKLAETLGPILENHPAFPQKTNVQFITSDDDTSVQIEIWERGSGYTLGSGSSSCAVVCMLSYLFDKKSTIISVNMPGGVLEVCNENNVFSFKNLAYKIAEIETHG